jgi:hypothetical protein
MPLRDHFHPPVSRKVSWEEIHGQWPARIVIQLKEQLPSGYVCGPKVHRGAQIEVDIAAYELDGSPGGFSSNGHGGGAALATAPWTVPEPTLAVETDIPDDDEYEVRVYDAERERTLVAVIEIVSPANKDRRENRNAFVAKCAALLRAGVAVSIVDVVTDRHANLYAELLDFMGLTDPKLGAEPPATYAASCRWGPSVRRARLETWSHVLTLGQPLPKLPLWLAPQLVIPLDLEASYEKTCDDLSVS